MQTDKPTKNKRSEPLSPKTSSSAGVQQYEDMIRIKIPITVRCCFSVPPENIGKPKGFLMFSGGIEKQHGDVMGYM